jgi:hypothetical protein
VPLHYLADVGHARTQGSGLGRLRYSEGEPYRPVRLPTARRAIYRGVRLDRRTTFDARFWLAAAARFATLGGFTRDVVFEPGETFGALRRRTSVIAADAFCTSANVLGASSCALVSAAAESWINGVDVV